MVTIFDVADLAGVSQATVSRVMHGRDRVDPATISRVQKAAEALGYTTRKTGPGRPRTRSHVYVQTQLGICARCNQLFIPRQPNQKRCDDCRVRVLEPGRTNRNGYGRDHQKLRAELAPIVALGQTECWRCGEKIKPREPWDLGHDDHDKSIYRGPEHRGENRRAGWLKSPLRGVLKLG